MIRSIWKEFWAKLPVCAGDDYQVLFFMETIPFANSDVGPKVVYPKYYKNYAYALAHELISVCFSLFWPKKGLPMKIGKINLQM